MKRPTSRQGVIALTAVMGVALLAPTSAGAIEGTFSADAEGSQLFVDAVNFNALTAEPPVNSITNLGISPTQGQVDTAGLEGFDGKTSRGFGQNLDLSLFDQEIPLDLSTAEQTAPPDNAEPAVTTAIDLNQAAPLLTGSVSQSTAHARDPQAVECPDEGRATISEGTSTTSDLGILEIDEEAGTTLASVRDNAGQGTLTSTSGTYLGSAGEVIAESQAQSAAVNVAGELDIEVLNPVLTATATGTPGGATVEYTGEVRVNGEKIAGAQENKLSLDALRDVLVPLDEEALDQLFVPLDENVLNEVFGGLAETPFVDGEQLTGEQLAGLIDDGSVDLDQLAFLEPTVLVTAGQLENVEEAADGTRAAAEVKTVRVELNLVSTLAETEVPIFTFHLMPLSTEANAPAGGLNCGDAADDDPFANLRKDASTAVVAPGDTFDYTITVPNDAGCTVTDVTVTDVITEGPDGFTITSASDGGQIDGNSVTWSVDEIAPGASESFTLTVQVPNDATGGETFTDEVTAEGDCDGAPATGQFLLPDIPRVETGGAAPDSLPRTGGGFALLGIAGLAAASGLWRRR